MPRFTASKGIALHYEVVGSPKADTIILLHAMPFDHRMWLYQMAHFSQYFRVASLDFPGYGKSDPVGARSISIADLAGMVRALYGELDIESATLCGLSIGSRVAKQFALDYQPLVKALILAGCSSGKVSKETMEGQIQNYRRFGLAYRAEGIRALVSKEYASSSLGEHLVSMITETNPTTDVESLISLFRALSVFDITSKLHQITVPTVIILGEFDGALPGSLELHRGISGSEHRVIKGAGHACAMEKPWEFDALVLNFLKAKGLLPQRSTPL